MTRDTETRHSANEVREKVEPSFTKWCWTTQWEYPMRTKRDTVIKDHAAAEHPRESSSESVNYRNTAVLE